MWRVFTSFTLQVQRLVEQVAGDEGATHVQAAAVLRAAGDKEATDGVCSGACSRTRLQAL
jgi:hypothetical protein